MWHEQHIVYWHHQVKCDLLIGTTKENTYDQLIGTTDYTNAINLPLCQRT